MAALINSTGGATLTVGTVSQIVQCTKIDYVSVTIIGDASTGTLSIQQRLTPTGTWYAYAPNGSAEAFTNTTLSSATATHNEVYLVGGCELRFSLATAGALTIHVSGDYTFPKPITYT